MLQLILSVFFSKFKPSTGQILIGSIINTRSPFEPKYILRDFSYLEVLLPNIISKKI